MSSSKDEVEIMLPQGKLIRIAGKDFVIKPFVIKNRLYFIRIVAEAVLGLVNDNKTLNILNIMDVMGEKIVDIYVIVLGEKKEWLEQNVTIKEETVIVDTILEVNDIDFLVERVKAIMGKVKKEKKD